MPFKNEKFESTGETKTVFGRTFYQIRAVVAIAAIGLNVGDIGGWIEKESCLSVSGDAWVSGDAQVSPINIIGLKWTVTITDAQMTIGCQTHLLASWWAFSEREIIAMDRQALKFWKLHRAYFQAICADSGRPSGLEKV